MQPSTKTLLEDMFLRKKPVKLLMALKIGGPVKYISMLSKETDCTFSHTVKLLENFRQLGLVNFDKMGRVKYIKLTPDGEELANYFENVLRKFSKMVIKSVPVFEKPTPILEKPTQLSEKAKLLKPIPIVQKLIVKK
ncbi:MAG: hypothetical protein HZB65_04030 [Candidatus Aenigmarchaeota archaeon]|nr:hypothetical protein [Candidatus Aenigmarchaeota archaeon]